MRSNCKTCPYVYKDRVAVSHITKMGFCFKNLIDVTYDCALNNVIYLIECKKCGIQYVGETSRSLSCRFGQHRRSIEKKDRTTKLYEHFLTKNHAISDMSVRILEAVPREKGKAGLLEAENLWIRVLHTAYPYGLNEKIKGYGLASESSPIESKYQPYFNYIGVSYRERKRKAKHRRQQKCQLSLDDLIKEYENNKDMRKVFCFLKKMSKKELNKAIEKLNNLEFVLSKELKLATLGYIAVMFKPKETVKKEFYRLPVQFPNKGMEIIRYENIFKYKSLIKEIPIEFSQLKPVSVTYQYETPTSLLLCNYSKLLNNLDAKQLIEIEQQRCECDQLKPFVYPPAGHIVSGNLNIIQNQNLRKVFSKGSKYRMPKEVTWAEVQEHGILGLLRYLEYLQRKYHLSRAELAKYETKFRRILKSQIFKAKKSDHGYKNVKCPLEKRDYEELKRIHKSFIVVPADKAANNLILVCKKYYLQIMNKELGIEVNHNRITVKGNSVYEPADTDFEALMSKHGKICKSFNLSLSEANKKIPKLFANPKLHKIPYKFRFIAGATESSTKPLGVLLKKLLCFLRNHFKNYCVAMYRNDKIKRFWSIDSTQDALRLLQNVQKGGKLKSIITCDFSTLFTSLPHLTIVDNMTFLIDLCYKNSGKKYITCSKTGDRIRYTDTTHSEQLCYQSHELKELLITVLSETYIRYGEYIFRQKQGVPMGGNFSSQLSDLCLSVIEFKAQSNKNEIERSKRNCHSVRYIDDILSLDNEDFMDDSNAIYPSDLPLQRTNNASLIQANFLDTTIFGQPNFKLEIYNKTDDFAFRVVRYGHIDSNVHSNTGYNTFYSQLVRFARIATNQENFENSTVEMFQTFLSQGFERKKLVFKFYSFAEKYKGLLIKYGILKKTDVICLMQRMFDHLG